MKIILVGKSASGKDTIAVELNKRYGLNVYKSYTDRPPRSKDDNYHTFLTADRFNNIMKEETVVAYLQKKNYRVCSTKESIKNSNILFLNPKAVMEIVNDMKEERFIVFWIQPREEQRIQFLRKRYEKNGESDIDEKIKNSEEEDDKLFNSNIQKELFYSTVGNNISHSVFIIPYEYNKNFLDKSVDIIYKMYEYYSSLYGE